jgi:hypothetical protein
MPNGFREVKSSRCEAAVLPGSYSLRHRRQKGEKVQLSLTRRSLLPCCLDIRERAAAYRGGCVVGFHSRATAIFYGSDYAAKEIFPMRPKRSLKRFPQNTEA